MLIYYAFQLILLAMQNKNMICKNSVLSVCFVNVNVY